MGLLPPIIYSGYNANNFNPTLMYLYDPSTNSYRALEPSDLSAQSQGDSAISGQQGARTGIGYVFQATERKQGFISNIGTSPIFVALSGIASPSNFSFILKGGNVNQDGLGASWTFDNWAGTVSVSGSNIYYTAWEF